MFNVGPTELIVILILALLVFGPKKLPEVAKSVGRGLSEFRRASDEVRDEIQRGLNFDDDDPPASDLSTTVTAPAEETSEVKSEISEVKSSQTLVEGNGVAPEGNGLAPGGNATEQAD
jgi:TatA/E family protein of Tat protein translocase